MEKITGRQLTREEYERLHNSQRVLYTRMWEILPKEEDESAACGYRELELRPATEEETEIFRLVSKTAVDAILFGCEIRAAMNTAEFSLVEMADAGLITELNTYVSWYCPVVEFLRKIGIDY